MRPGLRTIVEFLLSAQCAHDRKHALSGGRLRPCCFREYGRSADRPQVFGDERRD